MIPYLNMEDKAGMSTMKFYSRRQSLKVAAEAACLVAGVAAAPGRSRAAAPIMLRMYSSLPTDENSSHYVWYREFKAALESRTGGQIAVNFFPNSQLGAEAAAIQQVRLGAIDMMISGTSIWATIAPEIGVLDLGYLFDGWDDVGRALNGQPGKTLAQQLEQKGNVHILGYGYSLGARNIFTRNLVTTPQDLRNVKIRVLPVPNFMATLKAMGVTPIPMPGGEVYSGLQTGVIDGLEHDAPTVLASKFYEIAKYCALTQHIYNPIVAVINQNSFKRIPDALKADFLAAAAEATERECATAKISEAKAFDALKKQGLTMHEIDRAYFRQAVKPVWTDFSARYALAAQVLHEIEADS